MGICKLTGKKGKFVKSHIIPKSVTRPSQPGNKFYQADPINPEQRYFKRSDSWYDKSIVTREGEDVLSDLDSYAIKELRSWGLLWSSTTLRKRASNSLQEITVVEFQEPEKMRKFFLSLLWRASVSTLPEFREITLSQEKLERLRQILMGECSDDFSFFPIALVQLPTKGPVHNFVPIKQKIGKHKKEIYRFYMDGLIAHIHLSDPKLAVLVEPIPYDHPMFVGYQQTIVTQVETSVSFHLGNLFKLHNEFLNNHPSLKKEALGGI
ncbi:hypothetical protein C2869_02980 [Saccharobesus litoralis]|uniref:Uncharacterized protein n=1 Tax=Saccharobesus litoralis TaxID=2172099 RepID=A0A2S0VMQ8_9ALTE|nr:hypothetical protein [Saccharobesus litoralis]AWB65462.1 hypothetical protein C2869_02980 [Saccharobesus litoralis]